MDKFERTSLRNIAKGDQWSAEFSRLINAGMEPVISIRQAMIDGIKSDDDATRWVARLAAMKWQEILELCNQESEATHE